MTWFSDLTGIAPETPQNVARALSVQGARLVSKHALNRPQIGTLTLPQLQDLRAHAVPNGPRTTLRERVADVQDLHLDPSNAGTVFQVASQFNLLEMVAPNVTPEQGVGIYENDPTQGPACAIACGAGTIYRNYFAPVGGSSGQTEHRQIDCLSALAKTLDNSTHRYWEMKNGYALPTDDGFIRLNTVLAAKSPEQLDHLRGLLQIGVQSHTEVTLPAGGHCVTQIYCSAMPVAYGEGSKPLWQPIATLVLEAAYEATLRAAVVNAQTTGNRKTYLTLLGGGAFGNDREWIVQALLRALLQVEFSGLDVEIVSHMAPNPIVEQIITRWKSS
nr:hypothetical protein [Amylibacter sp.]